MKAWSLPFEWYKEKQRLESLDIVGVIDLDKFSEDKLIYQGIKIPIIIPKSERGYSFIRKYKLNEFDDFYFETYVNKEIVVLYGNCHLQNLQEILCCSSEFVERYYIHTILPIFEIPDSSYFDLPIFSKCDVFLHQSIRKDNRYGEDFSSDKIIKKLKPSCKVYSIPNIYHLSMCYFPQFIEKVELKRLNGGTVFFRDAMVENGIAEGLGLQEIVQQYVSKKDIYSNNIIEEKWITYIEKVKQRELDWDIKVSAFIEKYKYNNRFFYDPNHPTEFLMRYIASETLKLLGLDIEISNQITVKMDTYEIPLVRDVVDYFEFDYMLKSYELRKTGAKYVVGKMKIEEYVKEYVALLWQDKSYSVFFRSKSFIRYLIMMTKYWLSKIIERICK